MKKINIGLIAIFIVLLSVGCSIPNSSSSSEELNSSNDSTSVETSSSDDSSSSSSSSGSSSVDNSDANLGTPNLIIDKETGVVTWDKIEGATHYNYIINDGEVLTTTGNTISLNDQEVLSVQASSDSEYSDFSSAVIFYDTSPVDIEVKEEAKVYFHNSNISSLSVEVGETINKPSNPTKINHTFDDWYKDPFFNEKFDFSSPIEENTIIYANWIKDDLIDDTYFWIKASPKITSDIISSTTSSTGWRFIPLKLNTKQTEFKEFYATVQVSGATTTNPANFIFMDGFDDNPGRTYWKYNGGDFTIKSDGTYNIYFSLEHQYSEGCHGLTYQTTNTGLSYLARRNANLDIKTPVVNVDASTNKASWTKDNNALSYEVKINDNEVQTITSNSIDLAKSSCISIRSVYPNGYKSNWSIPKANIQVNYIYPEVEEYNYAHVYFKDSNEPSTKVEKNSQIEGITLQGDGVRTFEGWYLESSLKTKVTFPYTVSENVTFYPKWNYPSDIYTKDYYKLVDNNGTLIDGLIWNYDNYDFYEYELVEKVLDAKTYHIKSLDGNTTYETFSIGKKGTYSIYFSEDKLWDDPSDTTQKRNVYIRHDKINIYFTNSLNWTGTIYSYMWNKSTNEPKASWPGVEATFVETNDMGQDIYCTQIDLVQYNYIIFTNGSKQTVDINVSSVSNNQAYYAKDSTDSSGHYQVGTWTYSE